MTRFVMTIPQAAELVIKAGVLAKGMEIFILKMPVLKIIDLANVMLHKFAPRYAYDIEHNPMKIIGKRVGEKLYEELMTVEESAFAFENGDMFIVYPPHMYDVKKKYDFTPPAGYKPVAIGEYSSYTARIIDNQEIEKYLVELEL